MQLAFYIAGIMAGVVTIITSTIAVTSSINRLRTDLAILRVELNVVMKRLEKLEARHAAAS